MRHCSFPFNHAQLILSACLGFGASVSVGAEVPFSHFDGFESGTKGIVGISSHGTEVFNWSDSVRTEVSSEKSKSGNFSLKFYYPAAQDGSDSFSEQRFAIPQGASVIKLSYDLYIPDNYIHRDQSSSENNKFLLLWSGNYGALASDQSVGFEYWPGFIWGGSSNGSVVSYNLAPGATNWGHEFPSDLQIISYEDRGQWVNYEVFVKLSSEFEQDGRITVKKNGALIFEDQNIPNYSSSGNILNQGYLLGWSNSGFLENTYFYIDNFSIMVGEQNSPPNPPVLETAM